MPNHKCILRIRKATKHRPLKLTSTISIVGIEYQYCARCKQKTQIVSPNHMDLLTIIAERIKNKTEIVYNPHKQR
jgi:hypothetical protein